MPSFELSRLSPALPSQLVFNLIANSPSPELEESLTSRMDSSWLEAQSLPFANAVRSKENWYIKILDADNDLATKWAVEAQLLQLDEITAERRSASVDHVFALLECMPPKHTHEVSSDLFIMTPQGTQERSSSHQL